jgi:Na+-translocating ferredoxin:NAD+ oxidoreductase RnfG subunit
LRDLTRLIVTLVAVTVAAAVLLGGVDLITAPAIAARQEEDYRNALEEYFPGNGRI